MPDKDFATAARALHEAIERLRKDGVGDPCSICATLATWGRALYAEGIEDASREVTNRFDIDHLRQLAARVQEGKA